MCAVISVQGVLHHHATLGPYNTGHIIAFLDALHAVVQDRPQQPRPFLNAIEELFSAWQWKVYDRQPHARMTHLKAMEEARGDIEVGSIQGWIRHTW